MDIIERLENSIVVPKRFPGDRERTATLAERMDYYATPGLSIARIYNGQIDWTYTYGVQEAGCPAPITDETRFLAGSISKMLTALAVFHFAEQGLLDVDEDVNTYLRRWKVPANGDWQPRVTVAQLLSHTSGVNVKRPYGYGRQQPLPMLLQILNGELPANTPSLFVSAPPGPIHYSSGGYTIIQQMLEDLLDAPFCQIMQHAVLEPLGMHHSTFEQPPPPAVWDKLATGHPYGFRPLSDQWPLYVDAASAGLWSTPTDLALCTIEMQAAKAGRSQNVISQESARRMMTPPGFGTRLSPTQSEMFGHDGWSLGHMSTLWAHQDFDAGTVIMRNAAQGNMDFALEILTTLASHYVGSGGWGSPVSPNPENLAEYVGTYEVADTCLQVILIESVLHLQVPDQPPFALTPRYEDFFLADAFAGSLSFVRDSAGKVESLKTPWEWYEGRAARKVS